jgi:hypothetical protein
MKASYMFVHVALTSAAAADAMREKGKQHEVTWGNRELYKKFPQAP